jgi:ribosome-associated translation inhibitor RaiA
MPQPSIEFHIKQNDYFATLATVLDQLAQDLRKQKQKRHAATLLRLRDDLTHLQSNYRIEKATT